MVVQLLFVVSVDLVETELDVATSDAMALTAAYDQPVNAAIAFAASTDLAPVGL